MNTLIPTIIGMAAVTYIPRLMPFLFLGGRTVPRRVDAFLKCIPLAALGALIIRLIESSKLMETIYALTSGGPGSSTETTSYLLYIRGLREFQIGYTASLSIIYLAIMIIALTIFARSMSRLMIGRQGPVRV